MCIISSLFSPTSPACTVKLLNWKNSLVKKRDEKGLSPLHYAALSGFSCRTSQLLDVDNSVAYISDNDSNIALHIAVSRGCCSIVKILMSHSPDCWEITNDKRQNILHTALKEKRKAIVKYILQNSRAISTLITQKDIDGNTPLHFLAASLIRHPMADKKALNKEKFTPLDMITDRYSTTRLRLRLAGGTLSLRKRNSIIKDMRKGTTAIEDPAIVANKQKERLNNIRKGADTSVIVAALILTVTFTAGFTMPGGYNQSGVENLVPGMAVLSKRLAFQAFVISDAIALLFSSIAIFLNFWAGMASKHNSCVESSHCRWKFCYCRHYSDDGCIQYNDLCSVGTITSPCSHRMCCWCPIFSPFFLIVPNTNWYAAQVF
ncbi:unnamed protein product [Ilex paraguariensis]|uniref:PGG domain-containing protein n=1 Tax=Ilex paraguariensis TaxID=185542 RepID=A0ABC8RW35_9AQUA